MTNVELVLYALLALVAVGAAVIVVVSRSPTRGAHALGVVALAAATLVGFFANAPLVAVALVLLPGSVVAAVLLMGLMVPPIKTSNARPRVMAAAAVAAVVVVLGILVLAPNQAANLNPSVAAPAAASREADALTDLLSRRHLASFCVIGFLLLAATLAIVESNRPDDPSGAGEDS